MQNNYCTKILQNHDDELVVVLQYAQAAAYLCDSEDIIVEFHNARDLLLHLTAKTNNYSSNFCK